MAEATINQTMVLVNDWKTLPCKSLVLAKLLCDLLCCCIYAIESIGFVFVGVVGLIDPFDLAASEEHDSGDLFSSTIFFVFRILQGVCCLSIVSNCSFCALSAAISVSKLLLESITLSDSCENEMKTVFLKNTIH